MKKQEIAHQQGYNLSPEEINVLCYIWTNTPKGRSCSTDETYVDLSNPTDDCTIPTQRVFVAILLANDGLLEQHHANVNRFRLTAKGERLHKSFYS